MKMQCFSALFATVGLRSGMGRESVVHSSVPVGRGFNPGKQQTIHLKINQRDEVALAKRIGLFATVKL
jgi:hypothetical protein